MLFPNRGWSTIETPPIVTRRYLWRVVAAAPTWIVPSSGGDAARRKRRRDNTRAPTR